MPVGGCNKTFLSLLDVGQSSAGCCCGVFAAGVADNFVVTESVAKCVFVLHGFITVGLLDARLVVLV